jgi:hypothetical protein
MENNFSVNQRWRPRDAGERARIRFDVHLWSTVKWRKSVYPQVAVELRKMPAFLNEQADLADAAESSKRPHAQRVSNKDLQHAPSASALKERLAALEAGAA